MGMADKPEKPLLCPDCESKLEWDGVQYHCPKCAWSEHKAKPPSTSKIVLPDELKRKPEDPRNQNN
jgi:tRNA(Ile2) C34 agmatinyltransferase TiaS